MTPRHNAQSGGYFEEAVEALRSAGDPRILWRAVGDHYKGSILEPHQRAGDAAQRRLWQLRSSVLFSALAAEAYANEILAELVAPADAQALDRLPTVEKLLLGPRVAGLESPLDRSREPIQTIRQLFKTRDLLVHPRKGSPAAFWRYVTDTDEDLIGPRPAGRFVVAVARMMASLDPLRPPPPVIFQPGRLIGKHPHVLDRHLKDLGPTLHAVPPEAGDSPVSLATLASRREAQAHAARAGGPSDAQSGTPTPASPQSSHQ